MSDLIQLERSDADPLAPAPKAVRAGDYVFTSSIYPVDDAGLVVLNDPRRGETGPSAMEVQARKCLEILGAVIADFGGGLGDVLKAEIHLASADDFHEFNLVWREMFPSAPPARTCVEVGDTLPVPGALLNIDAVALAGGSKLKREVLSDPDGADPVEAEGAAHAVRAGHFVFCSAFPATNFETGLAVGRPAGFPNYGSEAEMQAEYIFARLNRVLAGAGTSLEQAIESQLYEPDLGNFHDVDGIWAKYMPTPPPRSSMAVTSLILPGALCAANLTVLVPGDGYAKQESHEGIRWHPVTVRQVNFSPTVKVGPWRFFAGQVASPDFKSAFTVPEGLRRYRSDIEEQTRYTMDMLTEQIEANDTDWDHCHHARVYLTEPRRDYRGFMRVWREYFPDPAKAPALAYVPSTGIMFDGPLVEIDPTCVARG